MASYLLFVVDDHERSATWSHTTGHRGKPCLMFPDDEDAWIVLTHGKRTTFIHISADGHLTVEEPIDG